MLNKRSNLVERRLYEYTLHAVCSPLNIFDFGTSVDQLAAYVAQLFNIAPEEHDEIFLHTQKTQPCKVALSVDIKKARDLLGEDQNGLSDPYCKVGVVSTSNNHSDTVAGALSSTSITPPPSPSQLKRTSSLFSCVSSSSRHNRSKSPASLRCRRSSKSSNRRYSHDHSSPFAALKHGKASSVISFRTGIRPKTINPEWNEHFEFELGNVPEQHLLISVYDSDRGQVPRMKTIVQEKRGVSQKIRGMRTFFATGRIEDDFLGQLMLDIKTIATYDGEQWFALTGMNQNRSHSGKARGDILLGLKIHFKLDDRSSAESFCTSHKNLLEFRRRHSTLSSSSSSDKKTSSIISRPSIFRKNFRPSAVQVRDYSSTSIFEHDLQAHINNKDTCLTPIMDGDLPLFIEEYHQLVRIVMLHKLEDVREQYKDQSNNLVIPWDGALNDISHGVLTPFRILYNIPVLSESFIHLLVIMELRCSEEYAPFISQGVIEAYLKLFTDRVRPRSDGNDLDFTDYEKTVFKEIFDLFIGHYKQRVHNDAQWFIPSKESLPSIQSIFETICTLLQLKICSNEMSIKTHLEETIKIRLQTDINDVFGRKSFIFNETNDIQLNLIREYLDFMQKIVDSMSMITEYNKLFALFNISYIRICFFQSNSAGDQLSDLTKCLLANMTDYFQTYSKPIVRATSSRYDPNLIQSSTILLKLYGYLQKIVTALRNSLEAREWGTNAFALKLLDYRTWFLPMMNFLLEGFVAHIRQAMERALEDDKDPISDEDIVLYSESSRAATGLCMKLCQEWELLDYPDINVRYTAMIRLTNTICEQCQHYARRTSRKVSENNYFIDLKRTRSFNVSKKLCILVNDIEYVKRNVLSSLPKLLNFTGVIEKMIQKYESTDFQQTQVTLERLITTAEHEMTDVIKLILEHVGTLYYTSLQSKIANYYREEKRSKSNCMDAVNDYIDQEILHQLFKGLEQIQYSRVACAIRIKTLQCLRELLPAQETPDFYSRVLHSFEKLVIYFDKVCLDETQQPCPPCEEVVTFRRTLQTHASTTEQLQLHYYREVCQVHWPHEYQSHSGEIVFRTAYEIVNSLVTISVFILCCQNLPKMDLIGSSDPYVILELLPFSIYQKIPKVYRTSTQKETLDPEFNESFHWHRLPLNILSTNGAVLRLSVWDKDMVNDDFIGECFVPLSNIETSKNLASIRDVPASEVHLRKPQRNLQPRTFELIRNRAGFDEQAAAFLKQRSAVMQAGSGSDVASTGSDDKLSSGSFCLRHYLQRQLLDSKSTSHHSMQPILNNNHYRSWSIRNWRTGGGSVDASVETLDENVTTQP